MNYLIQIKKLKKSYLDTVNLHCKKTYKKNYRNKRKSLTRSISDILKKRSSSYDVLENNEFLIITDNYNIYVK